MIKIPSQNKRFNQSNSSDRFGNIFQTKNISFEDKGYITLSKPTRVIADSTNEVDMFNSTSAPVSSATFRNNEHWFVGSDTLYFTAPSADGVTYANFPKFIKDTTASTPTLDTTSKNDSCEMWGDLYIATSSNISKYTSTWSTFSALNYSLLTPFQNLNQLAAKRTSNEVDLLDESGNVVTTLVIQEDYQITSMAYNNNRLYLGTFKDDGTSNVIYEWDGFTSKANTFYRVEGTATFAVTPYKNGVAYITSNGELGYCYGGTQTLEKLPIYYEDNYWYFIPSFGTAANPVGFHSMWADGDNIYLAITGRNDNAFDREQPQYTIDMPSGVWCYDPEVGLHHKYSIGQSRILTTNRIATTDVNTTTNIITVSGVTVPETGTPCFYKSDYAGTVTNIGGLKSGVQYFTIKESGTTLKLATTRANALAGTAIDLTGTGTASQYITFHPQYDFGAGHASVKNIFPTGTGTYRYAGKHLNTEMMICGSVQNSTATSIFGIATVSSVVANQENRGYIVTPKIESDEIEDNQISLTLKWRTLKDESDKIVVKYRNQDDDLDNFVTNNTPNFTLTAADTITTTQDLSSVGVGDEIEIVSGAGAGYLAHITSISEANGTYTVVFDEEIRNFTANDRGLAIFQSWKKLDTVDVNSKENGQGYKTITLNKKSKWTQYKIELRGIEIQLEDIIINNKTERPIK